MSLMDSVTLDNSVDLSAPPSDYATVLEQVAPTITEKIAQQGGGGESWTDTLQRVLPMIVATAQQKQILNIQLERAKQGLPPLDNSQFGVGVNVGLSSETKNMLFLAALGIGAAIFLSRKRR